MPLGSFSPARTAARTLSTCRPSSSLCCTPCTQGDTGGVGAAECQWRQVKDVPPRPHPLLPPGGPPLFAATASLCWKWWCWEVGRGGEVWGRPAPNKDGGGVDLFLAAMCHSTQHLGVFAEMRPEQRPERCQRAPSTGAAARTLSTCPDDCMVNIH